MGRLGAAMEAARKQDRAALIIYLCGGDPSLEATVDLVAAAADAGADIVELGMPFSDPTADGPIIQQASERALRAGATMKGLLDVVRQLRESGTQVPILLFGYYNPILAYGLVELAADAAKAGVDGLLVVDLPPEEAAPLRAALGEQGLDYVPLLAPTSNADRVALARSVAAGFVYYVSMTGVTGAKAARLSDAAQRAKELSAELSQPVAVGFGVKRPSDVAAVAAHADGVVVGSAVVSAVAAADTVEQARGELKRLVADLRAATARGQS